MFPSRMTLYLHSPNRNHATQDEVSQKERFRTSGGTFSMAASYRGGALDLRARDDIIQKYQEPLDAKRILEEGKSRRTRSPGGAS